MRPCHARRCDGHHCRAAKHAGVLLEGGPRPEVHCRERRRSFSGSCRPFSAGNVGVHDRGGNCWAAEAPGIAAMARQEPAWSEHRRGAPERERQVRGAGPAGSAGGAPVLRGGRLPRPCRAGSSWPKRSRGLRRAAARPRGRKRLRRVPASPGGPWLRLHRPCVVPGFRRLAIKMAGPRDLFVQVRQVRPSPRPCR